MLPFPDRRECLILGSTVALGGLANLPLVRRVGTIGSPDDACTHWGISPNPTHSIIPVVGDGKWIWREPPKDQTGYLEPRIFEVRVGVEATGKLDARDFIATTVAPTQHPEQEILDHRFETDGCDAKLQSLSDEATQLVVSTGRISDGQTIRGQAIFKLRVSKSYFGYRPSQFPAKQSVPRQSSKAYLSDSPGIETKIAALDKIIAETTKTADHPWDKARAFHQWVFDNIRGVPGDYTSVKRALETRSGDCEERAGVFIALCRAAGIPARLVWVPNHAWAEFMLIDESDRPHWIPAHTAAYSWFGWTGAHEIVLQKGDHVLQAGPDKKVRLLLDWWRCGGGKPKIKFTASVEPLAPDNDPEQDCGPGARTKHEDGRWSLVGSRTDNKLLRS